MNSQYRMARPRRPKNDQALTVLLVVVFVVFALATIITGIIVFFNYWGKDSGSSLAPQAASETGQQMPQIPADERYKQSLQSGDGPEATKWDGSSRVNILVMGLDSREDEGNMGRTDSIMVFTMDPSTHTAGMLSLPRDLWVNVPGNGEAKINTAYFLGTAYEGDGGGQKLAMKTVEEFLKVPINYYVLVNWDAFVKFIDAIGGVDIKIKEELVVDPVGPGNTVTLREGTQTLDGATALAYARARSSAHGDIDRANRQQQVIMSVRDNILNYYSLPKLISKAPSIYKSVADGVQTNLTLEEAILLAWGMKDIPEGEIKRKIISEPEHATAMLSVTGQYALVPIPEEIAAISEELFQTKIDPKQQEEAEPVETEDPMIKLQAEGARILIWNGTRTAGLATQAGDTLRAQGFTVVAEDNAPELYEISEIRYGGAGPYTLKKLKALMNISSSQVFNQNIDPGLNADIILILGDDWSMNTPTP